ncbi:MAG: DUF485 domain-containing protein [Desulfuromonadales bacterium]|nr:DUF485 domain-containing protein [Desulfuromonadales bacterium]NIS39788.1 DUF485 domain-containing protein [Desulfuromonadales bacterium]
MGHGPAVKLEKDNATGYKTKLGVKFFLFYTVLYFSFVAVNSIKPSFMQKVYMGQTVAVLYGFFLIIFAFLLALFYNKKCNAAEIRMNQ